MRVKAHIAERFSENLLVVRERVGFTRRDIDQKMGTATKYSARFEDHGTCPRIDTVYRVAKALGVKPSELLCVLDEIMEEENGKDTMG